MARFYTEDEITRFEANPYVISATDRFINFTAEFKQIFYSRYKETRKPKRILESLGFDIELLGYVRIHSITMHVVKEYETRGYFSDLNMRQSGEISPESASAYKIQYLEKELARTKQENEYLKKISSVSKKEMHR
jgi:hypothetical protein